MQNMITLFYINNLLIVFNYQIITLSNHQINYYLLLFQWPGFHIHPLRWFTQWPGTQNALW